MSSVSSIATSEASRRELVKRGLRNAEVEEAVRRREGVLWRAEEEVVWVEAFDKALDCPFIWPVCDDVDVKKDPPSPSLTRDRPEYSCPRLLGRDVRLVRPGAPECEELSVAEGDILYSDCPTLKDIERCTDVLG